MAIVARASATQVVTATSAGTSASATGFAGQLGSHTPSGPTPTSSSGWKSKGGTANNAAAEANAPNRNRSTPAREAARGVGDAQEQEQREVGALPEPAEHEDRRRIGRRQRERQGGEPERREQRAVAARRAAAPPRQPDEPGPRDEPCAVQRRRDRLGAMVAGEGELDDCGDDDRQGERRRPPRRNAARRRGPAHVGADGADGRDEAERSRHHTVESPRPSHAGATRAGHPGG